MAPEWAGKYARWVGTRASFLSTLVVGILAVATGVVNIGAGLSGGSTVLFGVTVPDIVLQITAFTGTITGFLLLLSAFGLRRGLRAALYAALALLPITVAQSLIQSASRSVPLLALSVVAFVLLVLNRQSFDREMDVTTTQIAALSALAGSQAYGTIGTFTLREEHFDGVNNLLDAFYFSLVTGSTVGYGDITPSTAVGELFTLSMLVLTVSSFAAVAGVVLSPLIETQLSKALGRMTEQQLELLENHVLVLGHGDLTEPILEELAGANTVVVTPDEERARRLTERGYTVLTGDPSDEDTQRTARIQTASAVVTATNNDAEDALAILTARELHPDVTIVAAVTQRENADKLKRAGADTVISPISLGAHFLAESALGGENVEELERRLLGDGPDSSDGTPDAE
ncbi:voltage-gated potassium channel [Halopelagius inordinatus]|uniref:Voltage-gated potassium channel n=1 Tax=Halopelagius inordinatus TaxID=553467 RepID=A0A1I2S8X4_9EURY|nr:NAD-binding protein [Halopelagius inordinatus]SFG47347.1 voltage-gated potassium channel [Halopelagius inordinatus]